jgi:hypothetical protein
MSVAKGVEMLAREATLTIIFFLLGPTINVKGGEVNMLWPVSKWSWRCQMELEGVN